MSQSTVNANAVTARFVIGLIGVDVAMLAAAMMTLEHLGGIALPGCGAGSACAELAAGAWGRLPGLAWPTAYLGLAYFAAAGVAWLVSRGRLPVGLRWVTRLGVLGSVLLIGVMIFLQHLCWYCLATHLGNLVWWLCAERGGRAARAGLRATVLAGLTFVGVTAGLVAIDAAQRSRVADRGERELSESIEQIIASGVEERKSDAVKLEPTTPPAADDPNDALTGQAAERDALPFTGRYRLGPARAAVRVVVFSSYQCQDCRRVELELREALATYDSLSLSAKQFPMCPDCNPHINVNMHPNACWGARAAEAAGLLAGNDGFWDMHHWLFDRGGGFTRAELREKLTQSGYDIAEFERLMMSDETLAPVQADADEAVALGLHYTPMIFINGVEFKGWFARDAVRRAIAAVAAEDPPALTAAADHPVPAEVKYIEDWQEQRQLTLPPDSPARSLGAAEPALEIVLWGDYQETNSGAADAWLRAYVAEHGDVRYTFRHYPIDQSCNPLTQVNKHPQACLAHRAAEAAAVVAGDDGYWRMHAWLFGHIAGFDEAALRVAVAELGLDKAAFDAAMDGSEIVAAIQSDAQAGKRVGLRAVPTIFIDGRRVPRWQREGRPVLGPILDTARKPE